MKRHYSFYLKNQKMPTLREAKNLIKEKVLGLPQGTIDNQYDIHSIRVCKSLQEHGFDKNTQMGGLLHALIEDGGMTFDELKELGYRDKTIELVEVTTQDISAEENFSRREKMIKKCIQAENMDAWAINLANLSDDLTECHLIADKEKLDIVLNKKCPVCIYYGNKYFAGTAFYTEFLQRYFDQMTTYHKYSV